MKYMLPRLGRKIVFPSCRLLPGVFFLGLVTLAGGYEVNRAARFDGDYGLRISVSSGLPRYVEDPTPMDETRYRCRFYFRLSQLALGEGEELHLFHALDSGDAEQLRLVIQKTAGQLRLRYEIRLNSGSYAVTPMGSEHLLGLGWHGLELDWRADTGDFSLTLDGTNAFEVMGLDNGDGSIDTVRLGAVNSPGAATGGAIDVDAFQSKRRSDIGILCFELSHFNETIAAWPKDGADRLVVLLNHRCVTPFKTKP